MDRRVDPQVAALVERGLDVVPRIVAGLAAGFPRHVDRVELARAGMLGLVEAASRFDSSRGVPFERFAATRVRGAVLDSVRSVDWAPRSVRSAARRIDLVENSLTSRFGRAPTLDELCSELGMAPAEVLRVRALVELSAIGALDRVVGSGESGRTTGDALVDRSQPEPVEILERRELLAYLREALDALPDRQRRVISGYFLDGASSADLARELGVTESRISQLRTVALLSLRRNISGRYGPATPTPDAVAPVQAPLATSA
jgi:RNA polymerase sigma factor for flagellar operon FliA